MAEKRVKRRLAAILAADVVGYSRLMGEDEAGTLAQLKQLREELLDPKVDEYGGRIVKTTGDGTLIEFPSAVDAVQHAVDVQHALTLRNADLPESKRFELRMGINLGDVIVEGEDIFGEGVNVAARLEGLADSGGICISDLIYASVRNKLSLDFDDLGEQALKNIAEPVQVFRVRMEVPRDENASVSDALFRRPAVAVLPFENLSNDPEQEYFADGLTEEIITALSLWRSFPVIARNSTFAYKGQSPDVRAVGDALGARYVIEGSVRKAGDRIRVTAQLLNAESGHHVWAERYDRQTADMFELQDELTTAIAAIVAPELERAEQRRVASQPRSVNIEAWALLQQAMTLIYAFNADDNARAQVLLDRVIDLDPNSCHAYGWKAFSFMRDVWLGFGDDRRRALDERLLAGRKAVELDESNSQAHAFFGIALLWSDQLKSALEESELAIRLNPSNAIACAGVGHILAVLGKTDEGVRASLRALQLNPIDPRNVAITAHIAIAYLIAGEFDLAETWAQRAVKRQANFAEAHFLRAVALSHLNRVEDAIEAFETCNSVSPGFVDQFASSRPYLDEAIIEQFFKGLRGANLLD